MGLAAFKDEFDGVFIAPPPPPQLPRKSPGVGASRDEMETILRDGRRLLLQWRTDMLVRTAHLETIFERAAGESAEFVKGLVEELEDRMHEMDEIIAEAEDGLDLPAETKHTMASIVAVEPSTRGFVRYAEKGYRRLARERLDFLVMLRDRLKVLIWDFDPDARGGEAFSNSDDLLASLRS